MGEIPPFWAGARAVAKTIDLRSLAEAAGGWQALEGVDVRGLVELGLAESLARRWLERGPARTRGQAVCLSDPRYPPWLAALPDAPPVLCVLGDVERLMARSIGIVGTRRCTPYGIAVTRHLAGALNARGIVVTSGLARGIDGHAHRSALPEGRTVAVLGHGLAHISPKTHEHLRDQIIAKGGAVISSFPDGVGPARWTFPVRNRWIAALSEEVVVVEAPVRSGALITATEAADLGRPVLAVPHALGQVSGAGCLQLLRDGATVLHDVRSFVNRVAPVGDDAEEEVGPIEHPWVAELVGGRTAGELASTVGVTEPAALATLVRLEVRGDVVRLPGHRFAPARGLRV